MYRAAMVKLEDETVLHAVGAGDLAIHAGDQCVVESGRSLEFGRVVKLTEHDGAVPARNGGAVILRRATLQDQAKAGENAVVGHMTAKTVHKRVEESKLPIHVVRIRYSFDRALLHITYTSEERVECPELIRSLGSELRARIEMRQIGVRDAARLIGGMGVCGRVLCCTSWRKDFDVVSVKMAKAQRLALNPGAIGGVCGRLKCCLKYEFECYRRQGAKLPRDGAVVLCPDGKGRVVDKDILANRIRVRMEDGRVLGFPAEQVSVVVDGAEQNEKDEERDV